MTRPRDWQSRFQAVLVERRYAPFAWGTNDCAIFGADCAMAVAGVDLADGMRDHRTAAGAAVVLKANGGLEQIVRNKLGEPISPLFAQVGDVGLALIDDRATIVVCGGSHWVGPGEHGSITLPMNSVSKAWRVS